MKIDFQSLLRASMQIAGTLAVLKPSLVPIIGSVTGLVEPVGVIVATTGVILGQFNAINHKKDLTKKVQKL